MNIQPANELEKILFAAVTDASARPAFLRALLESTLYMVPLGEKPEIENGVLKAGSKLSLEVLEKNGQRFTTFYTSPEMISRAACRPVEYLAMPSRSFFEMTRGSALVMNPNSYGKEFLPDEVTRLLDGTMFQPQTHKVEKDEKILIGQPARYPVQLTDALSKFFKTKRSVTKVFLAHYVNPARGPDPGLLIAIGIDNRAGWDAMIGEAGVLSQGLHPDHKSLDFVQYDETGAGISGYFKQGVKPFYQRSLLSSLFK